jgi:hypothetical protein
LGAVLGHRTQIDAPMGATRRSRRTRPQPGVRRVGIRLARSRRRGILFSMQPQMHVARLIIVRFVTCARARRNFARLQRELTIADLLSRSKSSERKPEMFRSARSTDCRSCFGCSLSNRETFSKRSNADEPPRFITATPERRRVDVVSRARGPHDRTNAPGQPSVLSQLGCDRWTALLLMREIGARHLSHAVCA